jgi:hypothetical protein
VNKALKSVGGNEATVKRMALATGGLVTNLELASTAAEALAKGLTEDLLDEAAAFATAFSQTTGKTFGAAFQQVENAFLKPTKEAFTNLGLDFQAYTDLIKEGFTQQEAAAKLMQDRLEEIGPLQGGLTTGIERQRVAWENFKETLANGVLPVMVDLAATVVAIGMAFNDWEALSLALKGQFQVLQSIARAQLTAGAVLQTSGPMLGPSQGMGFNFTNFPGIQRPAPKATGKAAAAAGGSRAQISPIALAAKDMATFTVELGKNTEAIRSNVFEGQMLLDNYAAMQADINATNALVDYFGASLSQAFEAALFSGRDFFEVMGDYLKNFVQQMVAALATAVALKGILSIFGLGQFSTVGSIFSGLMGFPKLAEGGLVTKPTLALIGERGPEAVVPLGRMGGMGGIEVATVRVSGNDLLLAIKRTDYAQRRAGSQYNY